MKKRCLILTIPVLALFVVCGLAYPQKAWSADPIVLKYADPSKSGTPRTRAAEDTMREIEKRTGGRVKHELYWAQSLLKSKDVLMGIKSRTCDLGMATAVMYHASRCPAWQFIQLLFVGGDDPRAVIKACNELYDTNALLRKEFDEMGVQLLTTTGSTPTLICSKRALREQKDFPGVRIRSVGAVAKFIGAMGGIPKSMKFFEVPEALARGVVDGTQTYLYATYGYKLYEYCKYHLLTGISQFVIDTWINRDILNKMPSDVRKTYIDTWRTFYVDRMAKYWDEERDRDLKAFKAAGVTMYTLTPEELANWKKVAEQINEEYYKKMEKKGIDGRKIVALYQSLYDRYERK